MTRLILACIVVLALAAALPHVRMGVYAERDWCAVWVAWR